MKTVALVSLMALALQSPARGAVPRLPPVPENQWSAEQRQVVARFAPDGRASPALRTYLHHPMLAENILPFERYISSESTLAPRHREILILRTAWMCRSRYIWAQHAEAARKAGISNEELTRVALGPGAPGWDPFEAALLRAADELHVDSFISDDTWHALAARYDTRAAIDAVFTVAEFTMLAGTVNSLGVQLEEHWTDSFPSDIPPTTAATGIHQRLVGRSARIVPLEPKEWTPDVRQLLDPSGTGRPVAAVYRTYAHAPAMDIPRRLVSEHIRQQSTLSALTRELLIIRISVLCRSEYEWAAHVPAGRRAGMTDAGIQRMVDGPKADGDSVETLLLRAADELYRDDVVSDETWNALTKTLDSRQMLDLLITTGGYRMFAMAINAFGVQLEPNAERFPPALR